MGYGLGESAWVGLRDNLEKAHKTWNPPAFARSAVRGWIAAYGPALESMWTSVERVLSTAASYGFRELATPEELYDDWQYAWQRWTRCRKGLPTTST